MPEEQPTTESQILAQLFRLDEKMEARLGRMSEDIAELKGEMRQMDRRFGDLINQMDKRFAGQDARVVNLEQLQRWTLGIMITSWLTIILTILLKL